VPATTWLSVGAPAAPTISVRTDAGRPMLEIVPTTRAAVPIGVGGTSTVAATPWLWVVQSRGESGWTTEVVPAAVRSRPLAPSGASPPREVRVTEIDRLGVASPAATLRAPF
jgi:hypothetical protein